MSDYRSEISRRRTFAIISHPDAGKTTLTEKFLLYGGAIAQAGEVKGKGGFFPIFLPFGRPSRAIPLRPRRFTSASPGPRPPESGPLPAPGSR